MVRLSVIFEIFYALGSRKRTNYFVNRAGAKPFAPLPLCGMVIFPLPEDHDGTALRKHAAYLSRETQAGRESGEHSSITRRRTSMDAH